MKIKTLEEAHVVYEALVLFRVQVMGFYLDAELEGEKARLNRKLAVIDTMIGSPSQ